MKKKTKKQIFLILFLMFPTIVFAESIESDFPIFMALFMEAFVSIHMSLFVLKPISDMIAKEKSKKLFWTLFFIRIGILSFFDIFITPYIAFFDFISVFIGALIGVPITAFITKTDIFGKSNQTTISTTSNISSSSEENQVNKVELKCAKCHALLRVSDKFCPQCGSGITGNNIIVATIKKLTFGPKKEAITPANFDQIYSLTEDKLLEEFINREIIKASIDKTANLLPSEVLKRKKILNIILSILVFVFITSYFFHFPIYFYIIGLIILLLFAKSANNYDLVKYLKKQIKSRPSEKISNIVMNVKGTLIPNNTKKMFIASLLIAIFMPLVIFSKPKIIYEKVDGGYAVRYYIFGLSNFTTVTIPENYKNEQVVSLRGNTFSNMPFLKSVKLPDTITEIRGQAFKNCKRLTTVNIPRNLEYLGGGAFYNAKSIKSIELPNTLTYLGGESFYKATSLEYIKLSENLTEIRGDTFEYCYSLKSITIPDNVTRIGAHAFYDDYNLTQVYISKYSRLAEIGSSAFRLCSSLYTITLPPNTFVNSRAFKESPTKIERYFIESDNDYYNNNYYNNTYTTNTYTSSTY